MLTTKSKCSTFELKVSIWKPNEMVSMLVFSGKFASNNARILLNVFSLKFKIEMAIPNAIKPNEMITNINIYQFD